jgi:hypothetical protein
MNSWMKRRISRSRARCQKAAAENKVRERRGQTESRRNKRDANNTPHAIPHPASDK